MKPKTDPGGRQDRDGSPTIAWFVSPHGFGHAARAAAVMQAVSTARPGTRHHVFTTVPREFFTEPNGDDCVVHHRCACDVGMIQRTPLVEDVEATIRALEEHVLNDPARVDRLAEDVAAQDCDLVVCDIAPLGLAVAQRLSIPGVVVESFTWDWIYRAYEDPRLDIHGDRMARLAESADLIIQTEPCCHRREGVPVVGPISRQPRDERALVRQRLGVSDEQEMILLSMSGADPAFIRDLRWSAPSRAVVVVPVSPGPDPDPDGVVVAGEVFHPDLVAASDLVIAKLGYSTVAEVVSAATRLAYLRRPQFPESPVLETFVCKNTPSAPLSPDWISDPTTFGVLEEILAQPRPTTPRPNGAADAATTILGFLDRST